ncbi:MAG: hypothetical protein ACRDOD_19375 [Streptosporangiaceae bacterium]
MSTRPPRALTMDEAARLTRREILDRAEAEQARLLARRSKTPAPHAQLSELMRIMRAAGITPEAGLDSLERTLAGERDGWWDERPLSPHKLTLGFDEQQGIVTGTCACGGWIPRGRYFLDRQVREEFSEHAAAEAAKA